MNINGYIILSRLEHDAYVDHIARVVEIVPPRSVPKTDLGANHVLGSRSMASYVVQPVALVLDGQIRRVYVDPVWPRGGEISAADDVMAETARGMEL